MADMGERRTPSPRGSVARMWEQRRRERVLLARLMREDREARRQVPPPPGCPSFVLPPPVPPFEIRIVRFVD